MQWALDAERALRDNLTVFFAYFFADLEEFMSATALTGHAAQVVGGFGTVVKGDAPKRLSSGASESNMNDLRFTSEDPRSHFDLKAYLNKRTQMNDSRQLVVFLQDFMHSQIFEKFCAQLIAKKHAQNARAAEMNVKRSSASITTTSTTSTAAAAEDDVDEDDTYERAVREWNQRALPLTIANIKLCVAASSGAAGGAKEMGSNFHALTVQFTSSSTPLAGCELDLDRDNTYYMSHLGPSNQSAEAQSNRYICCVCTCCSDTRRCSHYVL
jgi:hypothetical protein